MNKFTQVMLFYAFLTVIIVGLSWYFLKKMFPNPMIRIGLGLFIGVLISFMLWFTVGKKYVHGDSNTGY